MLQLTFVTEQNYFRFGRVHFHTVLGKPDNHSFEQLTWGRLQVSETSAGLRHTNLRVVCVSGPYDVKPINRCRQMHC